MRSKIAIALLCLGMTTVALAQYHNTGYVVTVSGDTLRGLIQEGSDSELRMEIGFSREKGAAFEKFLPHQLRVVRFDYGRTFKAIANARNANPQQQRLFAKRIVGGKIEFLTVGSDTYIFSKSDTLNIMVRPPVYRELTDKFGMSYRVKDLTHVKEMGKLMEDSPTTIQRIEKLHYSYQKLKEATILYNNEFADHNPVTVYKPKRKFNTRVTVGTGIGLAEGQKQFQVGLFGEITNVEKTNQISLLTGFVFSSWDSGSTNLLRQQYIAFYPMGINVQSKPARVRLYAHLDFGLINFVTTEQAYVFYDQFLGKFVSSTETVKETSPLFFNAAIGTKVALGNHALLFEISRTFGNMSAGNFISANIGFMY